MADNKNKKTATKVSRQVQASSPWGNSKSSSSSKTAAKVGAAAVGVASAAALAKTVHKKTFIIVIASFLVALLLGVGVCFFLSRNDTFEIVGNDELEMEFGQTYKDEGVKIIEFGIDVSNRAKVETNLKQNANGEYYGDEEKTYYMSYTVDTIKFGVIYKVTKIRLITFYDRDDRSEEEGV